MMNTTITSHAVLDGGVLDLLVALDSLIFPEPLSHEVFSAQLRGKINLRILIASRGSTPCGYKIGFEDSPRHFLSWSGGVIPEHRRQGVASLLLAAQHREAKALGYTSVQTRTKNKYREMLLLNIKQGFDVIGVYKHSYEKFHGIMLEKSLE